MDVKVVRCVQMAGSDLGVGVVIRQFDSRSGD